MLDQAFTLAAQSALVLITALLLTILLRHASAAQRHCVWTIALGLLALLPFWPAGSWTWRQDHLLVPAAASSSRFTVSVTAGEAPFDWLLALKAIWLAGFLLLLLRIAVGHWTLHRLRRRAQPGPAGCLISSELSGPIVMGLARPVILLPTAALTWPQERLRVVLLHEAMHIERRDLWWSLLGQLVAAVYWPNPLVWLALSRQREESEKASDDGVVNAGIRATEYADHLVSIASARTLDLWMLAQPAASGLEMARTNQLEKRIKSMFSPLNSRAPVGKASAAFAALAGLLLLAPVAGWRIAAQDSRTDSGIVGTVSDASGAAVPGAKVIVTFPATATPTAAMQGVRREVLRSSPAGEFRFAPLPAGVYTMQVRKEGFAQLEQAGVVVEAGKTTAVKLMLNVGQLQENITIRGNDPAPASADSFRPLPPPLPPPPAPVRDALSSGLATAASQSPGGPVKIRVGGNVMASKLEQKIAPRYPADCKAEHLEGTVLLRAVIGKDGTVVALESVNEFVDQRFRDSAMEAVRQWRYRPTLLNGQPVEVVTEVEVNFTLLP